MNDDVFSVCALLMCSLFTREEETFLPHKRIAEEEGVGIPSFDVLVDAARTCGMGYIFFYTKKIDW